MRNRKVGKGRCLKRKKYRGKDLVDRGHCFEHWNSLGCWRNSKFGRSYVVANQNLILSYTREVGEVGDGLITQLSCIVKRITYITFQPAYLRKKLPQSCQHSAHWNEDRVG